MSREGVRSVQVWDRTAYKLVATYDCYLFSFFTPPVLSPEPVMLQDGTYMHPGDQIIEAKGKFRSAGFHHIIMNDGYAIRYAGSYSGEAKEANSPMLCFEQYKDGQLLPIDFPPGCKTYIGYLEMFNSSWLFCTPSIASRIVETSFVKRVNVQFCRKGKT